MAEREWQVASDLSSRLMELCEAVGDRHSVFPQRFGRGRKQYYQWRDGTQLPGRTVLELAAEKNKWPLEIFEEGGRRPKELVNRAVNERPRRGAMMVGESRLEVPYGSPVKEVINDAFLETASPEYLRHFAAFEVNDSIQRGEPMTPKRFLWWVEHAIAAGQRAAQAGKPEHQRRQAKG